jgi:hypothetical protein
VTEINYRVMSFNGQLRTCEPALKKLDLEQMEAGQEMV